MTDSVDISMVEVFPEIMAGLMTSNPTNAGWYLCYLKDGSTEQLEWNEELKCFFKANTPAAGGDSVRTDAIHGWDPNSWMTSVQYMPGSQWKP